MLEIIRLASVGLTMLCIVAAEATSAESRAEVVVELAAYHSAPTIMAKVTRDDLVMPLEFSVTSPRSTWPRPSNEAMRALQTYYEVGLRGDVPGFLALFADDGTREKMRAWAGSSEKLKQNFAPLEKVRIEHAFYFENVTSVAVVHVFNGQTLPLRFDFYCAEGKCQITRSQLQREVIGEIAYALRKNRIFRPAEQAIYSSFLNVPISDQGKGLPISLGINVETFPTGVSLKGTIASDAQTNKVKKAIEAFYTSISTGNIQTLLASKTNKTELRKEEFDWIVYEAQSDKSLRGIHYDWDPFRSWLLSWSDLKYRGLVLWTGGGALYIIPLKTVDSRSNAYGALQVIPIKEDQDGYVVDIAPIKQRQLSVATSPSVLNALSRKWNLHTDQDK